MWLAVMSRSLGGRGGYDYPTKAHTGDGSAGANGRWHKRGVAEISGLTKLKGFLFFILTQVVSSAEEDVENFGLCL